ncbi:hypothetical protein DDE01_08380 [Desulfovibrio desulfuricans]|nr:hypothetical protein DDE01_08380 [Desulfovibrio desulfuricans]
MKVGWRLRTQQGIQGKLARSARKKVGTAHHLCHAHGDVIDNDGKLVGKDTIGTAKRKIATTRLPARLLWAEQAVVKGKDTIRPPQTHGWPTSFLLLAAALFDGKVATCTWIRGPEVAGMGSPGQRSQLLACAVAGVHCPKGGKNIKDSRVVLYTATLHVRTAWSPDIRPFVPIKPEPSQIGHDAFCVFGPCPVRVDILHAQEDLPARLSGGQPCEHECPGIAEMDVPRGTRGKAPPDHAVTRQN